MLLFLVGMHFKFTPAMMYFSTRNNKKVKSIICRIYECWSVILERNTREKIPVNILTLQFDLQISEKRQDLSKQRKIRSGLTRKRDPEVNTTLSSSTPVSNSSVKLDIFNKKKLSIAEIKRNHKIHRTPTKEKYEPVAIENGFGDSDDYELYFNQKTSRKQRNRVKIFSPDIYLIPDENESRDENNIDNLTGTEQIVCMKNKMKNQENSVRIFLPLCEKLSVSEDHF